MSECGLCNELRKKSDLLPEAYQTLVTSGKNLIWSSRQISLVPSFGPLNYSHSMIVPRIHTNSIAALPEDYKKEVSRLIDELQKRFRSHYGKSLVFFESGAGNLTYHSGGCILHAHIHCVESSDSFERGLFEEVALTRIDNPKDFKFSREFGYIWYKSSDGHEYVKNKPLLPSQFLRYLYMQSSSSPQKWNWRRDIDVPGMQRVIEIYAKIFT